MTVIAQGIQSDREFDLKGQGQRPYACLSEHWGKVSFANFASTEPNLFYTATLKLHERDGQLFFPKSVRLTVRSRSEEDLLVSWIAEFEISILTQFFFTHQLWKPRSDLVSFPFQTGWQYGHYRQIRCAVSLWISLPSLQRNALFYLMQSQWRNWTNCEAIPQYSQICDADFAKKCRGLWILM